MLLIMVRSVKEGRSLLFLLNYGREVEREDGDDTYQAEYCSTTSSSRDQGYMSSVYIVGLKWLFFIAVLLSTSIPPSGLRVAAQLTKYREGPQIYTIVSW